MKSIIVILLTTFNSISLSIAQDNPNEVYLSQVFKEAISASYEDSTRLNYSGYKIRVDNLPTIGYEEKSIYHYLINELDSSEYQVDSLGRIIVNSHIILNDISIEEVRLISLRNFHFRMGIILGLDMNPAIKEEALGLNSTYGNLVIINSKFSYISVIKGGKYGSIYLDSLDTESWLSIGGNTILNDLSITNSVFKGHTSIDNDQVKKINLVNCTFKPPTQNIVSQEKIDNPDWTYHPLIIGTPIYSLWLKNDPYDLHILRCKFLAGKKPQVVVISNTLNSLEIMNTHFESSLSLSGAKTLDRLVFSNNTFSAGISLSDFTFAEFQNKITWKDIGNDNLFSHILPISNVQQVDITIDATGFYPFFKPYKGITRDEISQEENFLGLLTSYHKLYDVFRTNGDLGSSNSSFAEMKDLEGRRLRYIYEESGGFRNYFRWKLNRLLKVYTNHGTDPALAIVISLYVILAFAIFYFFFPSEWDVTSKSKLIQNYKDFIQKNDKGYAKPLIMMVLGFGISLINALTLSLNSFTTLGFGTIPTRGLARYVCIIQGFIGWFLLSIFTVALINQVLT